MIRASLVLSLLAAAALAQDPPLPPSRTGKLYLTGNTSHDVGEFLPDGTHLRTFRPPAMRSPRGVAVDDRGDLVVVATDRVFLLDLDGNVIRTVTHPELTSGTGVARSPAGDWYVGNFFPGRVLVFDRSWNHLATRTAPNMSGVNCVSFDPGGGYAVSAALANRVLRFDAAGNPLGAVTHPQMGSPMSIARDSHGDHYLSNGTTGVVIRFDAAWNPRAVFGAGIFSQPQGIAIDEYDVLTITNFSSSVVHRLDRYGNLLGSFSTSGIHTARNLAFQIAPFTLARAGGVDAAQGHPVPVLRVNSSSGGPRGELTLPASGRLTLTIAGSPAGPWPAPFLLYAWPGLPGPGEVTALPFDLGWLSFPPPFAGGGPAVLVNSIGFAGILGAGVLAPVQAPVVLLDLQQGLGFPLDVTLQGVIADLGSRVAPVLALSPTNALALSLR